MNNDELEGEIKNLKRDINIVWWFAFVTFVLALAWISTERN
jgi:hypothetical protein